MLSITETIVYCIIKKHHVNKCSLEDSTHSDIHSALA